MDYGMIGKIEKAKLYAQERARVTFNSLTAEFRGDNNEYHITLGADGWDCSCPGFHQYAICPHVMTIERRLGPMLKRTPVPYSPGQNVVSDVEKAARYAEQGGRIQLLSFDVTFAGDNAVHQVSYDAGGWHCDTEFFRSRGVDSHTMALERILSGMLPTTAAQTTP